MQLCVMIKARVGLEETYAKGLEKVANQVGGRGKCLALAKGSAMLSFPQRLRALSAPRDAAIRATLHRQMRSTAVAKSSWFMRSRCACQAQKGPTSLEFCRACSIVLVHREPSRETAHETAKQAFRDGLDSGSFREGLEGLRSDLVNKAVQHRTLAKNISSDVLEPLTELRGQLSSKTKALVRTELAQKKRQTKKRKEKPRGCCSRDEGRAPVYPVFYVREVVSTSLFACGSAVVVCASRSPLDVMYLLSQSWPCLSCPHASLRRAHQAFPFARAFVCVQYSLGLRFDVHGDAITSRC